jgi:putative phosphoesterase
MKFLLISDVHGNLPALEAVLENSKDHDVIISLGDVVNYGPWSNECVELLDRPDIVTLRGNHEDYFIQGEYGGATSLVKMFFEKCYSTFTQMDTIKSYRSDYRIGDYLCTHTIDDLYVFEDTPVNLTENTFLGHSHAQFIRNVDGHLLVNPGSAGQNRRELNMINYATYDTSSGKVELKELMYDHTVVISEMKRLNYPEECINYYLRKPVRRGK